MKGIKEMSGESRQIMGGDKKCRGCVYFFPHAGQVMLNQPKVGDCRRYPPTAFLPSPQQTASFFPPVQDVNNCGEWSPRLSS